MMIIKRILSTILCLALMLSCAMVQAEAPAESEDFAGQLRLNMISETAKATATVHTFVDGDTVHFNVSEDVVPGGVFKARFLAIDTPESTGKIEEYGKKASAFTKEKLSGAEEIILESDDSQWNLDSTGGRYLVWVWYRPAGESKYRCLNLEILQNGLCKSSSTGNNRYGGTCVKALDYAKAEKLNIYSGQQDPDFYYGEAVELTLKELRTNLEAYNGIKVAFNGVAYMNDNMSVYVEAPDPETGLYFGMPVYYGYDLPGQALDILSVGNEVRIVGTLQYYEAGESWQVSGLKYRIMRPQDPGNVQKISEGHSAAFVPTDAATLNGTVTINVQDEPVTYDYAQLALATSVEVKDLRVLEVTANQEKGSSSYGAMTMTCDADGETVVVRTLPLYENSTLITKERYEGKTISVKGVVDCFDGVYQVKVLMPKHITIHE